MKHERFQSAGWEGDTQPESGRDRLETRKDAAKHNTPASAVTNQQLCPDCSRFDFRAAFEGDHPLGGTFIADVGERYRVGTYDDDCSLCLMLSRSRLSAKDIEQLNPDRSLFTGILDERDELRGYPFLWNKELVDCTKALPRNVQTWSMVLMVVPRMLRLESEPSVSQVVKKHIQISECAILQRDTPGNMFLACPLSARFDINHALSWIGYCDRHHTTLCSPPKSKGCRIKLLNCETLTVEEATDGSRYVALSYVWGPSTPVEEYVLRDNDGVHVLLSNSPKVISDAIDVTKSLDCQYLWIDKLCIDQQNAAEKHRQIQEMDIIYESALLTIIAAAGKDESHGLPRATREHPALSQKISLGGDLSIVWTAKDPHYAIRKSVWSTRGWTFQEAVLSRRRLVFLEDQVYFECNAMNCYESLMSPLDGLHVASKEQMHDSFRAGVFDRNESNPFGKFNTSSMQSFDVFNWYLSSVEAYTARKLRFDSDSWTAFSGVMRRFALKKRPVNEIWGLPYPVQCHRPIKNNYFAQSLLWSHTVNCWEDSDIPRRRPDFPSWSWVGWCGPVKYHVVPWGREGDRQSVIGRLELRESFPATSELDLRSSRGRTFGHLASPRTLLRMKVRLVPLSLFVYDFTRGFNDSYGGVESLSEINKTWKVAEYHASLHLSAGAISETSFQEQISGENRYQWCCAIIARLGDTKQTGTLILKRDDAVNKWVRVGQVIIDCSFETLMKAADLHGFGGKAMRKLNVA